MLCLRKKQNGKFSKVQERNWSNGKQSINVELELYYPNSDNSMQQNENKDFSNSINSSPSVVLNNKNVNLPAESDKTLFCFIAMMTVFIVNLISTVAVHERTPTMKQDREKAHPPLRDISHDISAEMSVDASAYLIISEIILLTTTACVVGLVILHPQKSIIFRRMFFLLAILFSARLITMNVTTLPTSSSVLYKCESKNPSFTFGVLISRLLELMPTCGLSFAENMKYCGNYVYSGHTVILILNCLMAAEYCPLTIVNWPMKTLTACSVIFILLSGFDYTISVIVAYYITTRVFWMYHTFANNPSLKEMNRTNQICKEWWYPIFRYLEGNVRDIVPPIYDFI